MTDLTTTDTTGLAAEIERLKAHNAELLAEKKEEKQKRAAAEAMLADVQTRLEAEIAEKAEKARAARARAIDAALVEASKNQGIVPEAMTDVCLRAKGLFTTDDDLTVSLADSESDKPVTAEDWIKSLKDTAPHLFYPAKGIGATGSGNFSGCFVLSETERNKQIQRAKDAAEKAQKDKTLAQNLGMR